MAHKQLTLADKTRINTLYNDALMTIKKITEVTGFSKGQIKRALRNPTITPRSGRPPTMSDKEKDELISYVVGSQEGRQASFRELSEKLFDKKFGEYAIRSTLRREGFKRYEATYKRPPSEKKKAT